MSDKGLRETPLKLIYSYYASRVKKLQWYPLTKYFEVMITVKIKNDVY